MFTKPQTWNLNGKKKHIIKTWKIQYTIQNNIHQHSNKAILLLFFSPAVLFAYNSPQFNFKKIMRSCNKHFNIFDIDSSPHSPRLDIANKISGMCKEYFNCKKKKWPMYFKYLYLYASFVCKNIEIEKVNKVFCYLKNDVFELESPC